MVKEKGGAGFPPGCGKTEGFSVLQAYAEKWRKENELKQDVANI
ncbi:hypothetical protein [Aneurinibacillus migulanus]|nr:hypothetical protein [Aneurinibacillus migulanus]GED16305.1 hypothetical protein AMI01nite_42960 [Aneurinibacillus migulanus]